VRNGAGSKAGRPARQPQPLEAWPLQRGIRRASRQAQDDPGAAAGQGPGRVRGSGNGDRLSRRLCPNVTGRSHISPVVIPIPRSALRAAGG